MMMEEKGQQSGEEFELVPDEEGLKDPSSSHFRKIAKLQEELSQCKKVRDEYLAGWQRAKADYLNFKREMELGEAMIRDFSAVQVWRKVIEIADALELAQKNLPHNLMTNDWAAGVLRIQEKLKKLFQDEGIEELEVAGRPYDPAIAEAIGAVSMFEQQDGTVAEVSEKGYQFVRGDKKILIRSAKVKIVKNI